MNLVRPRQLHLLAGVLVAVVVLLDQVTKSLVLGHLHGSSHLLGPLRIEVGTNDGAAFSSLQSKGWGLTVASVAIIAVVGMVMVRQRRPQMVVALALVVGGAIGNLIDRALRPGHGVVDFLTLPHFATFNLADVAITTGAGLAGWCLVVNPKGQRDG